MKTCVMAAGDRMGLHYLVGVGSKALRDGCSKGRRGSNYFAGVGYEDLCDGSRGQVGVALPCVGWL